MELADAFNAWQSTPCDDAEYYVKYRAYIEALYAAHGFTSDEYRKFFTRCSHCARDMPTDNLDPARVAINGVGFYHRGAAVCPSCVIKHFRFSAMHAIAAGGEGVLPWAARLAEAISFARRDESTIWLLEAILRGVMKLETKQEES